MNPGDMIGDALSTIGITDGRVEKWLGRPCGCKERRRRINQLWRWATRVTSGKHDNAEQYLDEILER